jgi:hypothetical protein
LSRAIRSASSLEIELDDREAQLAWIEADLGTAVQLLAVGNGGDVQLYARGRDPIEWDETTSTAAAVPDEAPVEEEPSTLTAH